MFNLFFFIIVFFVCHFQYINRDLNEDYESRTTSFLNIKLNEDVLNNSEVITKVVEELADRGLITHNLDAVLISEILTFYEEVCKTSKKMYFHYLFHFVNNFFVFSSHFYSKKPAD